VSEKTSENENGKIIVRKRGFVAEINNDSAAIIAYEGDGDRITIPKKINGKPVTHIADDAFLGKRLTCVILPSSLRTIGKYAFAGNYINKLQINKGLVSIGKGAFAKSKISSLKLPSSLISIGDGAFCENCINKLEIPPGLTIVGPWVFSCNRIMDLHISNGVTTIGHEAFSGNLIGCLIIPDSVTIMDVSAFNGNHLIKILMPSNVKLNFADSLSKLNSFAKLYEDTKKKAGVYAFHSKSWNVLKYDKILWQKEKRDILRISRIIEKYGKEYAGFTDKQLRQFDKKISKPIGSIPKAMWNKFDNHTKIWYYGLIDKHKAEVRYHEKGFGYITYPVIQIVYDKTSASIFIAMSNKLKLSVNGENFDFFNDPPEVCFEWLERIGEKHPDIKAEFIGCLCDENGTEISYSCDANLRECISIGNSIYGFDRDGNMSLGHWD